MTIQPNPTVSSVGYSQRRTGGFRKPSGWGRASRSRRPAGTHTVFQPKTDAAIMLRLRSYGGRRSRPPAGTYLRARLKECRGQEAAGTAEPFQVAPPEAAVYLNRNYFECGDRSPHFRRNFAIITGENTPSDRVILKGLAVPASRYTVGAKAGNPRGRGRNRGRNRYRNSKS